MERLQADCIGNLTHMRESRYALLGKTLRTFTETVVHHSAYACAIVRASFDLSTDIHIPHILTHFKYAQQGQEQYLTKVSGHNVIHLTNVPKWFKSDLSIPSYTPCARLEDCMCHMYEHNSCLFLPFASHSQNSCAYDGTRCK